MKTVKLCWATKRSNQAIEVYATAKLTPVASSVAGQPTPAEMASASVSACRSPAAVSAGTDRKNDNRVTATRSSPRSRPADIVAPDRDTPGTSARHWVRPMTRVSFQVTSSSCQSRRSSSYFSRLSVHWSARS